MGEDGRGQEALPQTAEDFLSDSSQVGPLEL